MTARRAQKRAAALRNAPYRNLIRLRKTEGMTGRYDVEMQGLNRLEPYNRIECHIVVYPYDRRINSDDIHFNPFEEYVQDVLSRQRSAYTEIPNSTDQLFGLLLGALIAIVFALVDPAGLLEIEALVSVIGAYVVAKELWNDLERLLVQATRNGRLRYQEGSYRYQLEKRTTLTAYSYLAKHRRYGKQALLPDKIDFIKQSNSQTLRMCFNVRDLTIHDARLAHLLSIQVEEKRADAFQGAARKDAGGSGGAFLFGVKLSFARRTLCWSRQVEVFQSLDAGRKGCLDDQGAWRDDAAFYRKTVTLGRLKLYLGKGLLPDAALIAP
jgi:hypothetical protein